MFYPKSKVFDTKQRAASTKYIAGLTHFSFSHTRAKHPQEKVKNVYTSEDNMWAHIKLPGQHNSSL